MKKKNKIVGKNTQKIQKQKNRIISTKKILGKMKEKTRKIIKEKMSKNNSKKKRINSKEK